MRVGIWHNLPSGGAKRALYQQVEGFLRTGWEVRAWCPDTADRTFLPLAGLIPERVVPFEPETRRPRSRVGKLLHLYRVAKLDIDRSRRQALECARQMEAWGVDVVLAHPCGLNLMSFIGEAVTGPPSVIYLQEPNRNLYEACATGAQRLRPPWAHPERPPGMGPQRWLNGLREVLVAYGNRYRIRAEWQASLAYRRILVNSAYSRESVLRAYGVDSRVCPLGVDLEQFRPVEVSRENVIVGLGSFTPAKDPILAIQAVARVPAEIRPSLTWIANVVHEDLLARAQAVAAEIGVRFELRRRVNHAELLHVLSSAILMLYTSRLEPFGYAPLEAAACGTPVVAVAEGGTRETLADGVTGFLAKGRCPLELGMLILRILSNPSLASSLRESARGHVMRKWSREGADAAIRFELLSVTGRSRDDAGVCASA